MAPEFGGGGVGGVVAGTVVAWLGTVVADDRNVGGVVAGGGVTMIGAVVAVVVGRLWGGAVVVVAGGGGGGIVAATVVVDPDACRAAATS